MHQDVLPTTNDVSKGERSTQLRGERDRPLGAFQRVLGSAGLSATGDDQRHTRDLEVVGELHGRSTIRVAEGRQRSLEDRVLDIPAQSPTLTRTALRASLGFKNERLGKALAARWSCPDDCAAPRWLATPQLIDRGEPFPFPIGS